MARLFSNRDRSFDLGALPTELLPRAVVQPTPVFANQKMQTGRVQMRCWEHCPNTGRFLTSIWMA